jgi:hypothetical protein
MCLRVVLLSDGETVHNAQIDVDGEGNICSLTLEHASEQAGSPRFSYEQVAA